MRAPLRLRAQLGLTVLEVLIASALLLMFLGSVFGLIWSLADRKQAMEFQTAPYGIGPPVLSLICEDLRHALLEPYEDLDAFKAEGDSMGGADTSKVDFVTAVMSRSQVRVDDEWVRAAVCEVGYRMRRSETSDGLFALYRREDFGVDDNPLEGGKYYKLCDRVAEFRIDFFEDDPGSPDSDEAEGELDWDAEDEGGLPFGARVTLVIMPPVDVDDRGDAVREVEPLEFVRYVNFTQRFDIATDRGGGNNSNNPGGG